MEQIRSLYQNCYQHTSTLLPQHCLVTPHGVTKQWLYVVQKTNAGVKLFITGSSKNHTDVTE